MTLQLLHLQLLKLLHNCEDLFHFYSLSGVHSYDLYHIHFTSVQLPLAYVTSELNRGHLPTTFYGAACSQLPVTQPSLPCVLRITPFFSVVWSIKLCRVLSCQFSSRRRLLHILNSMDVNDSPFDSWNICFKNSAVYRTHWQR